MFVLMGPTPDHRAAEAAMRDLLESDELPQPDRVEYRDASVVFFWDASRKAVIVDLTDGGPSDDA
jgi:hypothetical protein